MASFSNTDDIIDLRDVMARVDYSTVEFGDQTFLYR